MPSELTPSQIRTVQFRAVLRGLDRAEVERFLHSVADRVDELEAQLVEARQVPAVAGDLESEFNTVGQEVTAILQAAREAAEAMRERASLDAAKWRSEAMADAETLRRESASDAEALRRDAWATGTELLEQSSLQAKRITEQNERDVLTVMGEAEREAHRLTSGARREAEDLVRNATMTAEKMTAEATRRRDEIIDTANRQASVAQERTRALEQRRDELLEELESVRSTLNRLEGSLEQRLQSIDPGEPTSSVRLVPSPGGSESVEAAEEEAPRWELGETVRVVQPDSPAIRPVSEEEADTEDHLVILRPAPGSGPESKPQVAPPTQTASEPPADADHRSDSEPEEDVPPVTLDEEVVPETEPGPVVEADHEPQVESPPETVPQAPGDSGPELESEPEADSELETAVVTETSSPSDEGSDVGLLFASLRSGGRPPIDSVTEEAVTEEIVTDAEVGPEPEPDSQSEPVEQPEVQNEVPDSTGPAMSSREVGRDWIEERDRRLLPITNSALRDIKKAITELQNIALDRLRTEATWRPDPATDAEMLESHLSQLWAEAFATGHSVAEEMTGSPLDVPPVPNAPEIDEFAAALSRAVSAALDQAGEGQRERQSAASRIYRVWRSDEAEQRTRGVAILAYQRGIESSVHSDH